MRLFPKENDDWFWEMENVIITPHAGGATTKSPQRRLQILLDNLRRYLDDQPLRNVVDKKARY